jgi:uncharacterized protein
VTSPSSAASTTATTHGARDHARSQADLRVPAMPTVPATDATDLPSGIAATDIVWDEIVASGGYTHRRLGIGMHVRLTDLEGDACAALCLHSAIDPSERLNVADTVKVQWQAYLGAGTLLLSDRGRVLASIVEDTSGHHEALCGSSTRAGNEARYGDGSAHGPTPSARELLVLALAKHGLDRRDLPPTVAFFKSTRFDPDGTIRWAGGGGIGSHLVLRMEVPVILTIADVPHVLDPRATYTVTPLRVTAWKGAATAPGDPLWSAGPEGERAFLNTREHLRSIGTTA